jgi:type IV pilus assembly protein PilV
MTFSRRSVQRGVGLIEVLVAVLILSIGLLGLAGLQMRTLRDNQSALERGVAVMETHAIADAMRADRILATTNRYNIALGAEPPEGDTFRDVALREWLSNLENSLGPNATGSVTCNNSPACTIEIQWDDSRAGGGSTTQLLTTQVYL